MRLVFPVLIKPISQECSHRFRIFLDKVFYQFSSVLIVIILTLLAFVVLMSLRTKKEVEEEEELAVEDLLQSNIDELEGIETEQKSEARKLIENSAIYCCARHTS